jgi:hypothetical protein
MIIVEVIPDCFGQPIRLACIFGRLLSDTVGVIVSNDDPIPDCPRYVLQITCAKANIDRIADIASLHTFPNRNGSRITLAKYRDSFCVHAEGCAFGRLTMQELLIPLMVDELNPHQSVIHPHGYN